MLVDERGVLKLADFGASKLLLTTMSIVTMEVGPPHLNPSGTALTDTHTCAPPPLQDAMHGTANYMAPEVIKQTEKYDEKASLIYVHPDLNPDRQPGSC